MLKIIFLILFCSTQILASELKEIDWQISSEGDDFKIYIPKDYKHASGLVPIKFGVTLPHNIARVLSVLSDNKRKTEWIPNARKIKQIEKKSIKDFVVYYRYDSPWPLDDREFILKNIGSFNPKTYRVTVDIKSIEHKDIPKSDDIVRGITYDGYTIVESRGENSTYVEMAFLNDLGGNIPNWIINIVQKKWPYKFMKNISGQLEKKDIEILPEFKSSKAINSI